MVSSAFLMPLAEHTVLSAASSDDCDMRSEARKVPELGIKYSFDALLAVSADVIPEWEFFRHDGSSGLCGQRLGEATHPGPSELLTVGSTNPGGLPRKEPLAIEQGCGIWSYSETHLSSVTQKSTARALKACASKVDRHVRVHYGAPAPLRSRSNWAGTYTGVATTSDFCSKSLQVEWPAEIWSSGRVLATQHFVGNQMITVVTVYGLPRGPTWPRAASLTNDILEHITQQFVIGYQGIVLINGDFNFGPTELPCFDVWRSYGYISAQAFALQRWAQPVSMTCKGATERDMIWMSPMASSLCRAVQVQEVFHDHASVSVQLDIQALRPTIQTWPKPRELPWDNVRIQDWHQSCAELDFHPHNDSTQTMKALAQSFESSLTGFVDELPSGTLTSAHCGRAQRLQPAMMSPSPRTCKASRPGELQLMSDTIGAAVLTWFKQMRRIQSYKHAIVADNHHASAVQYRVELWSAIRRAPGFEPSFVDWWLQQDFAEAIGPLPLTPPTASQAVLIYQAFHHAFREFERWHLQQRQQVLLAKYDKTMKALFQDLRKPRPDQVDSFWECTSFHVTAIKEDTTSLLLHRPAPEVSTGTWSFQGKPLAVQGSVEELLVLHELPALSVGDSRRKFRSETSDNMDS
eukprot:s1104_g20.t1